MSEWACIYYKQAPCLDICHEFWIAQQRVSHSEHSLAMRAGNATMRVRVPASQQAARQRMATLWVAWLLGSLAVPLLRAHFFATETAAYRLQIFYYRSLRNMMFSGSVAQYMVRISV